MEKIFANPLLYAVIACLGYGVAGPVMKRAVAVGANANGLLFWYGAGALLVFVFNVGVRGQIALFGDHAGMILGLVMGVLFGVSFDSILKSFGMMPEGGLLTAVLAIAAMYPLVTAAIEIGFMQIPKGINLKLIVPGVILAMTGGILVSVGMSGR